MLIKGDIQVLFRLLTYVAGTYDDSVIVSYVTYIFSNVFTDVMFASRISWLSFLDHFSFNVLKVKVS